MELKSLPLIHVAHMPLMYEARQVPLARPTCHHSPRPALHMPVRVPLARTAITGVTPVPRATTHQHVHPQEGHTDDQSGANEPPRNEGLWGGLRSRQPIPGREPGAGGEGNLTSASPPSLACEGRMGGARGRSDV
jgi:hypothetical protein